MFPNLSLDIGMVLEGWIDSEVIEYLLDRLLVLISSGFYEFVHPRILFSFGVLFIVAFGFIGCPNCGGRRWVGSVTAPSRAKERQSSAEFQNDSL